MKTATDLIQRDVILHGDHIEITSDPRLHVRHISLAPVLGLGYWREKYNLESHRLSGYTHNIILPFMRIQFGILERKES